MLTIKQIKEIRGFLEKAQNPVFFFDNDVDGLMSFILLRRFIGRGRGIAIKSFPELDETYLKRVNELNADSVFILDKPLVSEKFFLGLKEKNLPVVWIDHHEKTMEFDKKHINYYNPLYNRNKKNEPVSLLAYQVSGKKEDLWLSMAGCIADNFFPDFTEEFAKENKTFWNKKFKVPFDVLYCSEFGKLIHILEFGLKDRTTNVVSMINFLFKIKSPMEILKEDITNMRIHKRYKEINTIYFKLVQKAKSFADNKKRILFFQYGGEMSLSSNIANELSYFFPDKIVIVVYVKGTIANISIRGKINVKEITLRAIKEIDGAIGGGHIHATGAKISINELEKFKDIFEEEIEKQQNI